MAARVVDSADVAESATLGDGTSIWHLAQVREDAVLGANCIVGRGAYIGTGVSMGDNCKVQNYALVYEPAKLGDGVFVGPAVVFTNDHFPRSVSPDGALKRGDDWEAVGVTCLEGASVGARAVSGGSAAPACRWSRWTSTDGGAPRPAPSTSNATTR